MTTKTRIRNWILITLFLVGFIYFLVATGKEHAIILNNEEGEAGVRYSIDGENYKDLGTKKIQRFVQGNSHTLYLKKSTGERMEKDFSLSSGDNTMELNVREILVEMKENTE